MSIGPAFDSVLAAAQAGGEQAWAEIYREYVGPVTSYMRSRTGEDPQDLASEVFMSVARSIHNFTGSEEQFRSWLFVIAHRRLRDARRAASRRIVVTDDEETLAALPAGDVEAEALARLSSRQAIAIVNTLSAAQRDVIMLRVVADLSVEHTAQVLGKKPGAVRALHHRALESLREKFSPEA